jgi:hypothetical protein
MFPDLDAPRRPRRRRWLIPLAITIIAAAVWWIGSLAQDELTVVAYLEDARDVADRQAPRAETFRQLLIDTSALQMDRQTFATTIDGLTAGIETDLAELEALEVPQEAFAVDVFLTLAMQRWLSGLEAFRASALALPTGADLAARTEVAESLTTLQVADAMYAEYLVEVAEVEAEAGLTASTPVDVEFVESSAGTPEGIDQLIQAILDNPGMAADQDLDIVSVGLEPAPTGGSTAEGFLQLPATESLLVTVVVRNDGTDPESGLEVRVVLATRDSVIEYSNVASVGELSAAGGSTAIEFADIPVNENIGYRLRVELARAGGGTIAVDTTELVVSPASG